MHNPKKKKIVTYKNVEEFLQTNDIPLLTFEELFDLVENDKLNDPIQKKIAQIILNAETDWIITIHSLNDFIVILEKEIDGDVNKSNLENLLKKYNRNIAKYTWEAESVSCLLDIFELTNEKDLRTIFYELTTGIK